MGSDADTVVNQMPEHPVAAKLFRAQIAFCRGDLVACRSAKKQFLQIIQIPVDFFGKLG